MEIKFLNLESMEKICHRVAMAVFNTKHDPICPFEEHTIALLDSALKLPGATFDGHDLYPTLIDKVAVLYYSLNKNHPFQNGNKRIATASLLVFLFINNHWLDSGIEEMTRLTLEVANSEPGKRDEILTKIKNWIKDHIVAVDESEKIK